MERHMVRGPLNKHFDLERKNAKQAEARLSQKLQRLEAICLYHVRSLTREQRQLQKDLQRLQQALTAEMTQEIYKTKSQVPLSHHTGPTKRKRQSLPQNNTTSHFMEEKPQAQEKDSINPPKAQDSDKGVSPLCQDQEVSPHTVDQGPGSSPAGDNGMVCGEETRSNDASIRPDHNTGKRNPLDPAECAGNFKGEPPLSTYLELFAKARNAHYLRHRVPPESERLLSIREIFGHKESS
ncbi:Coiled-coil domain-containing protein 190 [Camelus dromedarius]|uniref:Coiled-coil domain-containing protein 190 n=1 Tax=Camelus dromedarius TaxID=9838 RepID=A0A5N4CQ30_CAMDR|nr:Coiled-coil domain-containing protein 190 [Camelus dromedarius]